ncbi:MAG: hypothetical protein MUP16_00295 [Sedimentisphaerales bacterium]|nr:hypothetical protein [Sedimentisphaerales bacterium]
MKFLTKILLYGFLVWAVPFVTSVLIFPLKSSNRALWESIMPNVIAITTVVFAVLYLRRLQKNFLRDAISAGVIWLGVSLTLDLLLFMEGPMKMTFIDYMSDIGLTYVMVPVITTGFGYLLEKHTGQKTN